MYAAAGVIRDYSHVTDTCSVELTGMGVIDTWLDGVKLLTPIDRALAVSGAPVTVTFPDASRLCEGVVTAIAAGLSATNTQTSGVNQVTKTLRVGLATDGAGAAGPIAVTWPTPFSAAPTQVNASIDNGVGTITITAVTNTQCTITLAGAPASIKASLTLSAIGAA